jgi:antitoxin (DNA-binding transcriptional repressor) of toxin-antitoxin stability system
MKTLSPTQVRANMTRWLDEALAGKSIGITHKGRIVKLQPVPVTEDWAAAEYQMSGEELDQASSRVLEKGQELLSTGKAIAWEEFKKQRKR